MKLLTQNVTIVEDLIRASVKVRNALCTAAQLPELANKLDLALKPFETTIVTECWGMQDIETISKNLTEGQKLEVLETFANNQSKRDKTFDYQNLKETAHDVSIINLMG